jgi:two-component system OmpR family sensor kinase
MIAHDLRTPLTAVKGFTQLALRQNDLTPSLNRYLGIVANETNRLSTLLDDLVLLSQVEQGASVITSRPVDLEPLVQEAVRDVAALDPEGRLRPDRSLGDDATTVAVCDPELTRRALGNLLRTALKHSRNGHPVLYGVRPGLPGTGDPVVWVSPGVPLDGTLPTTLPMTGGPATATVDASADCESGPRGLGIYLCARLVERQGGQVWLDQLPEVGTRFVVMLPGGSGRQTTSNGGQRRWS